MKPLIIYLSKLNFISWTYTSTLQNKPKQSSEFVFLSWAKACNYVFEIWQSQNALVCRHEQTAMDRVRLRWPIVFFRASKTYWTLGVSGQVVRAGPNVLQSRSASSSHWVRFLEFLGGTKFRPKKHSRPNCYVNHPSYNHKWLRSVKVYFFILD